MDMFFNASKGVVKYRRRVHFHAVGPLNLSTPNESFAPFQISKYLPASSQVGSIYGGKDWTVEKNKTVRSNIF